MKLLIGMLAFTLTASSVALCQRTSLDASWIPTLATPDSNALQSRLTGDPRFSPMLRRAFPQRQWFWNDHHRFPSTGEVIETFTAVPGKALLDSGRYLTLPGCVPHDCTDNGLLWIDTAPGSTQLIAAINPEVGGGPGTHLWLFTSGNGFDWQKPDANFRFHLNQWLGTLTTGLPAPNDHEHVTLITIVRPDGHQQDLTPQEVLEQQPVAQQSGASK